MNCTYTAQGFLACPNINVRKIEPTNEHVVRRCIRRSNNIQQEYINRDDNPMLDECNRTIDQGKS